MARAAVWVSVLVLGWMWSLQGVPAETEGCSNQVNGPTEACEASDEEKERGPFNVTVCYDAPIVGRCKARKKRYFYNATTATCELFYYGGCGGNRNNFKTKVACLEHCHKSEED